MLRQDRLDRRRRVRSLNQDRQINVRGIHTSRRSAHRHFIVPSTDQLIHPRKLLRDDLLRQLRQGCGMNKQMRLPDRWRLRQLIG